MMENTTMKNDRGLAKKSKSELIEIIFRKDDIERRLREQINELMDYKAELEKKLSNQHETTLNKTQEQEGSDL